MCAVEGVPTHPVHTARPGSTPTQIMLELPGHWAGHAETGARVLSRETGSDSGCPPGFEREFPEEHSGTTRITDVGENVRIHQAPKVRNRVPADLGGLAQGHRFRIRLIERVLEFLSMDLAEIGEALVSIPQAQNLRLLSPTSW
jgi:hypothetical protein